LHIKFTLQKNCGRFVKRPYEWQYKYIFCEIYDSRGFVKVSYKGKKRFGHATRAVREGWERFCTKETYDLLRATRVWREGNLQRGFPTIKPFSERFYLPSYAFEKRVFRRPRTAEQANYRPVFWFHSREYEKDFEQSKPTIRSRRARGFAPHPTAFPQAGETFRVARISMREDL